MPTPVALGYLKSAPVHLSPQAIPSELRVRRRRIYLNKMFQRRVVAAARITLSHLNSTRSLGMPFQLPFDPLLNPFNSSLCRSVMFHRR